MSTDAPTAPETLVDPWLWLEDVDSPEARAWVEEHNRVTLDLIETRDDYRALYERHLAILTNPDRIAWPHLVGDRVVNFWQDKDHERGLLRSMPFADWLAGSREWRTLLDIDALAAEEDVHWVYHGSSWASPPSRRALVRLSRGGADAAEIREFDVETCSFVTGGFFVPEAKSSTAWLDEDTVFVGSNFGEGTMTRSGYARTIRRWTRGTRLEDAPVVFHGEEKDLGVFVERVRSADRTRVLITRAIGMFDQETYLVNGEDVIRLDVPLDAMLTVLNDRIVLRLRTPWAAADRVWEAESVIELSIEEYLGGRREFRLVLKPEERSAVEHIAASREALFVVLLRNASSELYRYRKIDGRWQGERIEAPEHGSIEYLDAGPEWDGALFSYSNFLQPTTLYIVDADSVQPRKVESQPSRFNADGLVVVQHETISADGTRIPYFLIRRQDLTLDGSTPTILYGYGGFNVSLTPGYQATTGAGWLEKGGAYVVANIRGGGEFGTAWHMSALREHRQRAYDDFIAVAEDLIARGVTSPRRLGIHGGSNGGLLVGAVMTQRPELFRAVCAQVPVLDMRRYHVMLAGASWVSEYGDPDNPKDWAFISEYSPYHKLSADVRYPRVLFATSTRDDRVHPAHARKMAARMEELGHACLFYENTEGGHAGAAGHRQVAMRNALVHTFFSMELGGDD